MICNAAPDWYPVRGPATPYHTHLFEEAVDGPHQGLHGGQPVAHGHPGRHLQHTGAGRARGRGAGSSASDGVAMRTTARGGMMVVYAPAVGDAAGRTMANYPSGSMHAVMQFCIAHQHRPAAAHAHELGFLLHSTHARPPSRHTQPASVCTGILPSTAIHKPAQRRPAASTWPPFTPPP